MRRARQQDDGGGKSGALLAVSSSLSRAVAEERAREGRLRRTERRRREEEGTGEEEEEEEPAERKSEKKQRARERKRRKKTQAEESEDEHDEQEQEDELNEALAAENTHATKKERPDPLWVRGPLWRDLYHLADLPPAEPAWQSTRDVAEQRCQDAGFTIEANKSGYQIFLMHRVYELVNERKAGKRGKVIAMEAEVAQKQAYNEWSKLPANEKWWYLVRSSLVPGWRIRMWRDQVLGRAKAKKNALENQGSTTRRKKLSAKRKGRTGSSVKHNELEGEDAEEKVNAGKAPPVVGPFSAPKPAVPPPPLPLGGRIGLPMAASSARNWLCSECGSGDAGAPGGVCLMCAAFGSASLMLEDALEPQAPVCTNGDDELDMDIFGQMEDFPAFSNSAPVKKPKIEISGASAVSGKEDSNRVSKGKDATTEAASVPKSPCDNDEEELFEIDCIVSARGPAGPERHYRVKWVGYDDAWNTWEPRERLPREVTDDFDKEADSFVSPDVMNYAPAVSEIVNVLALDRFVASDEDALQVKMTNDAYLPHMLLPFGRVPMEIFADAHKEVWANESLRAEAAAAVDCWLQAKREELDDQVNIPQS